MLTVCHPGDEGVMGCPCANAPAVLGRGCDNSAGTGGAVMTASGTASLGADTLVFTTNGERPTALSLVLQGPASLSGGTDFGQGVRCLGGTIIRRLYVKTASGGSITVPDVLAFDPAISERSSEKGDLIQAGQSRWYLVYYRDSVVPGGCPSTSTFNATQTGRVDWSL